MKKLILFCALVSVVSAELLIAIPTASEAEQPKTTQVKVQNRREGARELLIALPTSSAKAVKKQFANVDTENRQARKIIVRPPLQRLYPSQWDQQESLQEYSLVPVEIDQMGRFTMQQEKTQDMDIQQSTSASFSMPSFLPAPLQNLFQTQNQPQQDRTANQQDTASAFSSYLPTSLQSIFQKQQPESQQEPTSYKAEMSPNGGISITIKLEPHQIPGLGLQQQQQVSQPQQEQPTTQKYQSQASQTQNTIVAAPTTAQAATMEYDSPSGFWKEVRTLLAGLPLPKLFATSETKPGLIAQSSQIQNNYVQPQQLANYFQNVGQANTNQLQKQNQQQQQGLRSLSQPQVNIITQQNPVQVQLQQQQRGQQQQQQKQQQRQQKTTYKPQVLMAKPNPFPPNNYLLNNPNPTTAAPTAEDAETPMLVNLASSIAKTVGEIPSNLDLLFNDMGRTYRKHLFQLRDSLPENPYSGYNFNFKRRSKKGGRKQHQQQQQQVITDEYLDGYGV